MNRDEILKALRRHRDELRQRFGVKSLAIFGSVARGEAGPDSDMNVLVEFDPQAHIGLFKMAELEEFPGKLLGYSVDIVTSDGLRPWMRERVQKKMVHVAYTRERGSE